jgi:hypothetical protein
MKCLHQEPNSVQIMIASCACFAQSIYKNNMFTPITPEGTLQ